MNLDDFFSAALAELRQVINRATDLRARHGFKTPDGEGFDDARLDTLFLALPVSWKGTLVQYTGRLHRLHPGKSEVRIFDYVDREVPMLLRMFEKRLRGYRAIGYARSEAPLGYEGPNDDTVIDYDENVLAALERDDNFA